MPKLRAVLDTLDDVPEAYRDLYTEGEDGKYRLDAEGVEDVTGLKAALKAERVARRKANEKLASLPEDFDPDAYAQWRADQEKAEGEAAKAKNDWEARERQLVERHQRDVEKATNEAKRLKVALEKNLVDAAAAQAIASHRGSTKLLLPHIRSSVRVIEEDGDYQVVVVDGKGHPRIGEKTDRMTIDEYVAELKSSDDFARAFEGSGSSGGGATRSTGGAGSTKVVSTGDGPGFMANLDKIARGEVEVR